LQFSKAKQTLTPGYRPQSEDVTAEADAFGFWLLRQRTPQERLKMGKLLNRNARQFSISCFRQRFSNLSCSELAKKLAIAWLQEYNPPGYTPLGNQMTWVQDSISLAALLHPLLESLHIPYYITGGVAAIAYGEPRTTQDLDVVLSIQPAAISNLVSSLEQSGFYVPGLEDVTSGRMKTLQIIHIESIARADLIIAGDSKFDQEKFNRRQRYEISGGVEVYLASPEDLILNKLRWRRQNQSEKQWRDVLGILKIQGDLLNFDYMSRWSQTLEIAEDLSRAMREAGLSEILY
jgi:hypothetical protein